MRITSGSWDGETVFYPDQVLEVRSVDGRLHIARKGADTTSGTRRSRSMTRTAVATNSLRTEGCHAVTGGDA